jgi:hypothetical protein
MNDSTAQQVLQVLREVYDEIDNTGEIEVRPEMLAEAVRRRIDPENASPVLMSYAGVMQLRQMARSVCRRRIGEDDDSGQGQGALFDGQLQRRYPTKRHSSEVYVLRDHLTIAERRENISRLRAEAASKARHADALEAETEGLLARGDLADAA